MSAKVSSISSLVGEFDAHLSVRMGATDTIREAEADSFPIRADLYEADREGHPLVGSHIVERRGTDPRPVQHSHFVSRIDGRLIARLSRTSAHGDVVRALAEGLETTVAKSVQEYALQRLVSRLDMALFALDHDGGHGTKVAAGIRELWACSGAGTWAAYAEKRKMLLAWLEETT